MTSTRLQNKRDNRRRALQQRHKEYMVQAMNQTRTELENRACDVLSVSGLGSRALPIWEIRDSMEHENKAEKKARRQTRVSDRLGEIAADERKLVLRGNAATRTREHLRQNKSHARQERRKGKRPVLNQPRRGNLGCLRMLQTSGGSSKGYSVIRTIIPKKGHER